LPAPRLRGEQGGPARKDDVDERSGQRGSRSYDYDDDEEDARREERRAAERVHMFNEVP
jgi:hypothetical protein